MMVDEGRVECIECGASILPSTAVRNEGKCAPCKGGYKVDIEAGRERQRLQKLLYNSPQSRYWRDLVFRVDSVAQGFKSLSKPEQLYFAMGLLEGEVYNGGFDQYFFNSSGDYYEDAIQGLVLLNATKTVDLLRKAKTAIFGDLPFPLDTIPRREHLLGLVDTEGHSKFDAELSDLDRDFWQDPDGLGDKLESFGTEHGFWKSDAS